jgi:tetratricopeptide (TPR) repeat protein
MKKFFSLLLAISFSLGAFSQMGKVTSALSFIDQNLLDKAKESLDQALVNVKSKDNPKTYYAKGKLCQACFKSDNATFNALYKNPLDTAYAAYEKALKLDPKGSIEKQLKLNSVYLSLGNDYINQGVKSFEAKEFESALASFENNIKVSASPIYVGAIDTGIYFNAGLAAYNAKLYEKAVPHFQKCAELKYEGTTPWFLLYNCYINIKDAANAEVTLKKVFELYPDDKDVIMQLVDYYINNNRPQDAHSYIDIAKGKNPGDHSLWWAEGVIFMRQDKYDDAIASLNKSIELKGDQYDTQFNMGVCYYNKAVEMFQKANEIMDVTKYNAAVAEANKVFISAIPYFEKASNLKPDDVDSLKNLKELYFRLRTVNPDYETKYNAIVKRLEGK